ncbi:MAG: MATE family efflux transporter [Phycisphaerales bacterium]|jgi:MATE family multidrug resistance protein|nr:MATE family efflux transporter [Phycisphaerales bacterium]
MVEDTQPENKKLNLSDLRLAVREVWSLAWPTIITMTSFTVMQFVDKLMVSQVGPTEIAAQGNAGTWSFAIIATVMGVVTVVNTYVSQHLGAGTPKNGPKYPWAAGWMAAVSWLLIIVPFIFIVPHIFNHIHPSQEEVKLVVLETQYATYTLVGSFFLLIGRGFSQYFFGMHMPKIITVSTIIANVVNVIANYILIFGEDGVSGLVPGIPGTKALGLQGAAIATVIGMFMEMIIPLLIFLGPTFNNKYSTRAPWKPCLKTMRAIFKIGWPGAIQWGNEIICWALFMTVFVGKYGTNAMAAGYIALGYLHLSFMPAVGINVAINSVVGKYIGAKKPDVAVSRARVGVGIALVYMTFCATIFVVFRHELMEWFVNESSYTDQELQEIISIGANMLIMVALFQTVDALGIVYTGALRGAGDTVWPGVVTAVYSWVFIVVGGWVAVTYFPQTESIGPWIAAATYVILIGITMTIRFERGGWRSIKLIEGDESVEAARAAPLTIGPPSPEADVAIADFVDPPDIDK